MRALRNFSFIALVASLVCLKYAASLEAGTSCNPPAYGYGYVTVWGSGTCDPDFDDDMDCWGPCWDCFQIEDSGWIEFCDDNYDQTGHWFDAVCDCGVI